MINMTNPREKMILLVGVIVVILTILIAGIFLPYRSALQRLDGKITSRKAQLIEARTLVQRIKGMQDELTATDRRLTAGQSSPPLASTLEGLVAEIAGKEKILGIRPQPSTAPQGFRQEKVEMQLEKIRLDQLVRLLHAIDSARTMLQADSVKMRPRYEDPALLDVSLVVSSFVKAS